MSYILDALKKVERQKARKGTSAGLTNISGDLFLERVPKPSRGGFGKFIIVIVLVSLGTFAAAWLIFKGEKKKGPVATRPALSTAVAVPAVPVAPTPPTAPATVAPPTAPIPPPPTEQIALPRSTAPTASTPPPAPEPEVADNAERVERVKGKSAKIPVSRPQPAKMVVQTVPAPADIKLSGIAWQEERSMRRIVVNGFLLQEGAVISGAKVLEIHRDWVRFSSAAGIFDLRMDAASAAPGTPK